MKSRIFPPNVKKRIHCLASWQFWSLSVEQIAEHFYTDRLRLRRLYRERRSD